jgi:hypothetical protein|nr:MAG TPA: hypothetical protein [Caudoviricetes sp.]
MDKEDEEALEKLNLISEYVDICNLRIDVLKTRNNELTASLKILDYEMKRLNKAFQRTNRELIALKRATMYRRRRKRRG